MFSYKPPSCMATTWKWALILLLTTLHVSNLPNYRVASQETGRENCYLITFPDWRSCWPGESSGEKFTLCLFILLTDSKTGWGHLKRAFLVRKFFFLPDMCTLTHKHAVLQVQEPAAEWVWRREMVPKRLYI